MTEGPAKIGMKPTHPGEFVRAEILEPLALDVSRAKEWSTNYARYYEVQRDDIGRAARVDGTGSPWANGPPKARVVN